MEPETTRSPEGQAGVQSETPETTNINPKRASMDEIIANSRRVMAEAEGIEFDEPAESEPGKQEEQKSEAVPEQEQPPDQEQSEAEPDTSDTEPAKDQQGKAEPVFTVKVNGRDKTYTQSEALRLISLSDGSTERFQKAHEMLEEAKRLKAEADALKAKAPADTPKTEEPASTPDLDPVTIAKAIQYGTDQEAADAVTRLLATRTPQTDATAQQPSIDPQQIVAQAAAQVQRQMAKQQALTAFATEYPDIANDNRLSMLTANTVYAFVGHDLKELGHDISKMSQADLWQAYEEEQRLGHVKPDVDLFRAAGNATREWIKSTAKPADGGGTTAQTALDKRQERKRTLEQPPRAQNAKADLGKEEQKAPSGSQIVAQMRKARGLSL